jgi:ribonuclease BN (tRNA processing enzyme)
MSLSFVPLGVGDAFSALHYTSCVAVESGDELLLIDCPHPIQKMLREGGEAAKRSFSADRISGVVLTHLHADHASGLEGLAYFFHFVLHRKLPLLVHPAVAKRLWDGHLAAGMECLLPAVGQPHLEKKLEDYFEVIPLDEARAVQHGGFAVECRRTIHHIPTTALRIRGGGRCLGHSSDTAFDPELIAWLAEPDVFLHETNYGVHTPYEKLAALPGELRRKMRLTHYPDAFDFDESAIEAVHQGLVYSV